jgi:hypothetical protein
LEIENEDEEEDDVEDGEDDSFLATRGMAFANDIRAIIRLRPGGLNQKQRLNELK